MLVTAKRWLHSVRPNSSREYLRAFVEEAAASVSDGALVLDAGAGDCRYQTMFSRARYESADFCQVDKAYGEITYVCDLADIPAESSRYDLVLLTQVLEHIEDPQAVLAEMYRILKPSGQLWMSAPLFFAEHEVPYDFYRYTQYGLRYLLETTGFAIKRLDWLEGYYGTLSYQLATAATALPLKPEFYGGGLIGLATGGAMLVVKPLVLLLSIWFSRLDLRQKNVRSGYCKNYTVVAMKGSPD